MASVELEGVRKVYGGPEGHVAVAGATFTVEDGELVVLVGPSGCGKSTLLRMIAGLESTSAGEIRIDGRVVNDVAPQDRDIAMVFQSYALYPHMSVRENLAFGLRLRKTPKADVSAQVDRAAEILGIGPILDRKPKQLSGGQRQRVAVGRAIVRDPRVFLFDEPLSNLDARLRVQMRAELSALHRRLGATMVYVTHDQVEAMTLGDRIVVLNDGVIQQIDTPLALYDRPANRFVAGFLGSPAMNFVEGAIVRDGGARFRADRDAFEFPLPAWWAGQLGGRAERRLTLGVRPEHVWVSAARPEDAPAAEVPVVVDALEPLGNEVFIHATSAGHRITARVPPQEIPPAGEAGTLALDLRKLHFFDGETLEAMGAGGA
ncbi:MAG TPA: sn-glycerol-3-phosphate ABC transporter ATP-binding protein UgpC [Longimicrobiales bacterium]|nr:sn-glycerol-3-phosphate ABC transporter ATP-binding protein UgpC [Longimicrobiales bacterium]